PGIGESRLNPLAQAVVDSSPDHRRPAAAEVERIRDVDEHLPGQVLGPGHVKRVQADLPAGGVQQKLPELGGIRQRPLARALPGLPRPLDGILVSGLPRPHPNLMPKLDELAGQCLPDGAGPKNTNPHAATLASGCAPAHTFVTKRRDLWHFHRPMRSDSPTTLRRHASIPQATVPAARASTWCRQPRMSARTGASAPRTWWGVG